jgi:hypothetical protein
VREIRVALYEWMSAVLRDNRWTAAEWARRADVTPTNLTRFLKDPDAASLPGAETIGRLARAAGCQPRFAPDGGSDGQSSVGAWRVPLLKCGELAAMRALGPAGDVPAFLRGLLRGNGRQAVAVDERPSPGAFAVRISSRHLNAGGVIEDDVIVVEPADHHRPPRAGVLVVVLDGEHVCAYRHYPPLLVPVSTDSACVPMLCDDAAVLGVAVRIIRLLRH